MAAPVISLLSPDAAKPAPASSIIIQDSPVNDQGSVLATSTNLQVMSPRQRRAQSAGPIGPDHLPYGSSATSSSTVPYSVQQECRPGIIPVFKKHDGSG